MSPLNFLPIAVRFRPAGKWWIGECPHLDIVTQGETYERANENLQEAILAFFASCIERGTLEPILTDAGFSKQQITDLKQNACEHLSHLRHLNLQDTECRA